jgi:hypothetical protein
MKFLCVLALLFAIAPRAQAFEVYGLVSYDASQYSGKPSNYSDSGGGAGYGFFGKLDFGPGQIESGFLYTVTSISTQEPFGLAINSGSFWQIPILYRVYVLPPFVSVAFGPDYAIVGYNRVTVAGAEVSSDASSSGYKSNFGLEADVQGLQDLGENLSAILDIRYRYGLGNAISVDGAGVRYQAFIISIGLQKRLE